MKVWILAQFWIWKCSKFWNGFQNVVPVFNDEFRFILIIISLCPWVVFEAFSIKVCMLEFRNYKCVNEIIVYLRRIMLINSEIVMRSWCCFILIVSLHNHFILITMAWIGTTMACIGDCLSEGGCSLSKTNHGISEGSCSSVGTTCIIALHFICWVVSLHCWAE